MYFQLVETKMLSTQGQPDVFNLHRLTAEVLEDARAVALVTTGDEADVESDAV